MNPPTLDEWLAAAKLDRVQTSVVKSVVAQREQAIRAAEADLREALLALIGWWEVDAASDDKYAGQRATASEVHEVYADARNKREHAAQVRAVLNGGVTP